MSKKFLCIFVQWYLGVVDIEKGYLKEKKSLQWDIQAEREMLYAHPDKKYTKVETILCVFPF